ncbi:MAG: hypothetical protein Q8P24_16995 [Desulfobacterales bacterium]|nr:hypothetical protein [Desulfobacterales bacterium]
MNPQFYTGHVTPHKSFMKRLKALDKRLDCKYRVDAERFVVTWDEAAGPPSEVLMVRDDTGGFRHPDNRDLMMLAAGDLHRTDINERLNKTAKYMREYREKEQVKEVERIRDRTKDDKYQLMNAFRKVFNTGREIAPFGKQTPIKKGRTLDELNAAV